MNLNFAVADDGRSYKGKNRINNSKQKFQPDNVRQMFGQKKIVLGNVPVVVTGNSHIEEDVQQK